MDDLLMVGQRGDHLLKLTNARVGVRLDFRPCGRLARIAQREMTA